MITVDDGKATKLGCLLLELDDIAEMLSVAFTISCKSLYEIIQLVSLLIVLNCCDDKGRQKEDALICSVLAWCT